MQATAATAAAPPPTDDEDEDARRRRETVDPATYAAALAGTLRAVFDHMAASATLLDSASLTFELGLAPGVLLPNGSLCSHSAARQGGRERERERGRDCKRQRDRETGRERHSNRGSRGIE